MFRSLKTLCVAATLALTTLTAAAANVSQQDASSALKDALSQGAQIAVKQLGRPGGFSNDPNVRIELPGKLAKASKTLRMLGMGAQIDQLENGLNAAAEAAVPQAQAILLDSVKKMTISDARAILGGQQNAATQYLDKTSRAQIRDRFLPIVKQTTDKIDLAQQYNALVGRAAGLGAVNADSANLERYVTERALDGLFKVIAGQEAAVRQDPAGAATSIARRVFEAVR